MNKIEKIIFNHQQDRIEITIKQHANQMLHLFAEVDWFSLKSSVRSNVVLIEIEKIYNNLKQHFNNLGSLIEIEYRGVSNILKIKDIENIFPNIPIKWV